MKKIILSLLAALTVSLGACSQSEGYTITGTCDQTVDGDSVFLCCMQGFFAMVPEDTAVVKNGKFEFKGTMDGAAMRFICPMHTGEQINFATLILEDTDFKVTMKKGEKEIVEGGTAAALYKEYEDNVNALYPENFMALFNVMQDSTKTAEERKAAKAQHDAVEAKIAKYKYDFVMSHIPSPISDMLISDLGRDVKEADYNAILDKMEKSGKTYRNYKAIMAERAAQAATAVGQKYTDLAFSDPDGKTVRVSDYVTKNKYTMIDFWASWCGPCRAEMPWVVKAYEQFHSKGFEVIGVSLDNNKDAWVKAIAKLNMPWPHMSDLKGWECAAAKPYNIKAIPANVLIDQNGVIVAKNLREQALIDKLTELFK